MNEPCFQCDLDIPHVCYAGVPDARWGLNDRAIDALEAARCYLRRGIEGAPPMRKQKQSRKQYVVSTSGVGVATTFTAAEEKRVIAKARRLKISVEELIGRAIRGRVRVKAGRVDHVAISRAIDALAKGAR
jgi:hypothetical protein